MIKYYFSPETLGLYISSINKNIPSDAKEITEVRYLEMIGKTLIADSDGLPVIAQPSIPTLYVLKERKITDIKAACHAEITAGIDHDALGTAYHYPTNRDDQANLNGLVSKSILLGDAGGPYKFWCADANGAWVRRNHTSAQIQAIGLAVAAHVIAAQDNYALKLSDIDAAENEEDLDAVVW